jgi:D-glycero-alpha-D-manno-heptose-7-phosphate kinase
MVDSVERIEHPAVREALKLLDIDKGLEIVSISDIPSRGTGLGSSRTFVVALLHALHSFRGEFVNQDELAREAVKIERAILKESGGKQDQYIAAYGGVNVMKFLNNGSVEVTPLISHDSNLNKIEDSLLLLYTGRERKSKEIHNDQINGVSDNMDVYDRRKGLAEETFRVMCDGDADTLGKKMDENWLLKKSLSGKISDGWIDDLYSKAISLGAKRGKILGSGGGGFLLLVADRDKHEAISKELELRRTDFKFSYAGSRVIFVGD